MANIGIIGANGFIGRNLVTGLATNGHVVYAMTRTPADFQLENVRNISVSSPADVRKITTACGIIFYAASATTPSSSIDNPEMEGELNIRPFLSFIQSISNPSPPTVVYFSSGGTIYGDSACPVSELSPCQPRAFHGSAKVACEMFLSAWSRQYGGATVILRPSNVYGPGQRSQPGFGVVPTALRHLKDKTPFTVWGTGQATRDYIFVSDLVDLCLKIVERLPLTGVNIFNVASGRSISLNALLETIERVSGSGLIRQYRETRKFDVQSIAFDISKARKELAWVPKTSLESGIAQTLSTMAP